MKNFKKMIPFAGVAAIVLYYVFYFISTIISLFTTKNISVAIIFNTLGGMFKYLILFGFMAFYLIYGNIKKNDKNDKTMNILLLIAIGLLTLSHIRGIFSLISVIFKYAKYINKWLTASDIITVVSLIVSIAIWVLLALNIISILTKKKMPSKILTYVVYGLLAFTFILELASGITTLIRGINFIGLLILIIGLLETISMIAFKACLAYTINENTKNI